MAPALSLESQLGFPLLLGSTLQAFLAFVSHLCVFILDHLSSASSLSVRTSYASPPSGLWSWPDLALAQWKSLVSGACRLGALALSSRPSRSTVPVATHVMVWIKSCLEFSPHKTTKITVILTCFIPFIFLKTCGNRSFQNKKVQAYRHKYSLIFGPRQMTSETLPWYLSPNAIPPFFSLFLPISSSFLGLFTAIISSQGRTF